MDGYLTHTRVVAHLEAKLRIEFHGRVIEHLGIDMYQSPVAAIAELVSNAWDADSTVVDISLPKNVRDGAEIRIADNGDGMTLEQCQDRYLKVGYNRRKDRNSDKTTAGRPVMGRKGIGKFAGFGIASLVRVETVSKETGEKTVFQLDVERLTGAGDGPESRRPMEVEVLQYLPPDETRKSEHGTKLVLSQLTMKQTPNPAQFRRSMARRFLLLERADQFSVLVDGVRISEDEDAEKIQFDFPSAYKDEEMPPGLVINDGWGEEVLSNGQHIRWRFVFYRDTLSDEDLSGIAVFSHGKLSQRPFFFNLSGGIGGQQALSYMSGRVEADYIDDQEKDLISTERQRINWDAEAAQPLLDWGQKRVKNLLLRWQERRAEDKVKKINLKLSPFSNRLQKLESHERRIVDRALKAIARISVLSDDDFAQLANAILSAWEGGRLRELIDKLSQTAELDAEVLVKILAESRVMNALHAAERVRVQLNLIAGLEERIKNKELENAVRDYIAENPWMISPEWDTYKVEKSLNTIARDAGTHTLDQMDGWDRRIDLLLSSNDKVLVVEFMRPGLTANWDHISRFKQYVLTLRNSIYPSTAGIFKHVQGLMVADKLDSQGAIREEIDDLRSRGMDATDWNGLLYSSKKRWQDYFDILVDRAPDDERVLALVDSAGSEGEA
ncbi:ATP-binding protein [Micromonospora globosa]|uniref:ATP-binding protein n=1 Tax=Micromonospora globosa TaxID=47863 RepID=UPI000A02A6EF|nr:ATP-binding protein [Micromonospora globosa]